MTWRCTAASVDRADDLAGTASTVRSFLLVQSPGAWGVDILRDAALPEEVRTALRQLERTSGVRPVLIRRPGRQSSTRSGIRVFAAHATPTRTWVQTALLGDLRELLDLDLAGIAADRRPGLDDHVDPVFAVCTHGRHDVCCAELGRPVAEALGGHQPDLTWECSHIGGDRFAPNVLVLPDLLYYGRVAPAAAPGLVATHVAGHLDLDLLRGRCALPMPAQYAEVALRRELSVTGLRVLVPGRVARRDEVTTAVLEVVGDPPRTSYAVTVRTVAGPPGRLTCRARADNPVPRHTLVSIEASGSASVPAGVVG